MVPSNNKIYRIDCLTSQAEFFAIKEKYISMVRNVPDLPIFLDWEWISTWFRVYGRDLSPWVLIALKKTGGLVGIAPWMIEQLRFGVIQIRRITFFGADRLAPCHFKVILPVR